MYKNKELTMDFFKNKYFIFFVFLIYLSAIFCLYMHFLHENTYWVSAATAHHAYAKAALPATSGFLMFITSLLLIFVEKHWMVNLKINHPISIIYLCITWWAAFEISISFN